MSHALNLTTIISLLQPPPEVFNLFDDLLLLSNGKMLYHGPLQVCWHLSPADAVHCLVLYCMVQSAPAHVQYRTAQAAKSADHYTSIKVPDKLLPLLLSPFCAYSMRCATSRKWVSTVLCARTSLASCWRSQRKQVSTATAVWLGHQ
jgi:ABC-type multidrug transport system ATPase subunit